MDQVERETVVASELEPCKVLVVEDDDVNVMLVTEMLEFASRALGLQLEIVVARSASEARARWIDTSPALVMLDINLPDGRGDDVCKAMTQFATTDRPYVICSSASNMRDDPATLNSYGIDVLIPKPVNLNNLVTSMRGWRKSHASRRRYNDAVEVSAQAD